MFPAAMVSHAGRDEERGLAEDPEARILAQIPAPIAG